MAKVYVETYGCTLNQADSDIMKGVLLAAGHTICGCEQEADAVVVNTCTVKGATENKICERLGKLRRSGKPAVVAGCLVVNSARIRKALPGVVLLWPSALEHIGSAVNAALEGKTIEFREPKKMDCYPRLFTAPILRVPISEGCTGNCNYCQTKLARPVLKSYPKGTIMEWIDSGVRKGAREIQLTSMDCGCYGMDCKSGLVPLLESIAGMDGDFKVRLGMTNPEHLLRMREGIARMLLNKRFYRFIHMPVQSGSDKVCIEMGRKHTATEFEKLAAWLREAVPGITIATDVIAGYPTETEKDFEATVALLRRVRPDVVNVSKFSARPGTRAKGLPQLPNTEIKRRSTMLSALVKPICRENNEACIGREFEVLVTEKGRDFTGRTGSYKQVVLRGYRGRKGDVVRASISSANHGSLFGAEI